MVDVITTWFSLAGVIANCVIMWQMLLPPGRCYSHLGGGLADVIANVADVIATRVVIVL